MAGLRGLIGRLPALDPSGDPEAYGPLVRRYFARYGLAISGIDHRFGSFPGPGGRLAGHWFRPAEARSTVFVIHGYFDHTGLLANLIRHLVDRGVAVAAFDLPGHGLSQGKRGHVDDFREYAEALRNFAALGRGRLPEPWHLAGHSTGGAAILEFLFHPRSGDPRFDRVVLLAPLVRSAHWTLSRLAFPLVRPFVDHLPRRFRETSSDEGFLSFLRNDPLSVRRIPLAWVTAMVAWNRRIEDAGQIHRPVLVIQGTEDRVVDWRYNLRFLEGRIEGLKTRMVAGARHQLCNEAPPFRRAVFSALDRFLLPADP